MRAKKVIVFLISGVLAAACVYQIWLAARNLLANAPQRYVPADIHMVSQHEQWVGIGRERHKTLVTLGNHAGAPWCIVGNLHEGGWLFPSMQSESYRMQIDGGLAPGTVILSSFRWHPYFSYALGFAVCGLIFLFTAFICLSAAWPGTKI